MVNKKFSLLLILFSQFALAQTPAAGAGGAAPAAAPPAAKPAAKSSSTSSKASVNISFDDELVQGGVPKPQVDYISSGRQFNFKKMIKLRENFVPEVQKGKSEYGIAD